MRRAQLRLRQLTTVVAIAAFLAVTAVAGLPKPHAPGVGLRAVAQLSVGRRPEPDGIRWRHTL
jgi:hypothetical protein